MMGQNTGQPARGNRSGPDYLCIGMQKAGTGWLYDALLRMPGVHPHPIKEFHHFNFAHGRGRHRKVQMKRLRGYFKRARPTWENKETLRDFRQRLRDYVAAGYSTEAYLNLFNTPEGKIAGDITPAYSTLTPSKVKKVHAVLPSVKTILIVRNPVDRLWSGFNMSMRVEMRKEGFGNDEAGQEEMNRRSTLDALRAFSKTKPASRRSSASGAYQAWSKYYPDLKVIGFDDIVREPGRVLREVHDLLLPDGPAFEEYEVENRKAETLKVSASAEQRAFLFRHFADEIAACNRLFPDATRHWKTE